MEYFYVYFAENVFFSSPRRVRREYRLNKINYFERARVGVAQPRLPRPSAGDRLRRRGQL